MMYQWICRYWLPAGFLLFLTGLFLAPSAHNYKVIINYMLLLPGLIAACAAWKWWPQARAPRGLVSAIAAYLLYMAGNAALQNGEEGLKYLQWCFYIAVFLAAVGCCMRLSLAALAQLLWLAVLVATCAVIYAAVRDLNSGLLRAPGYRLTGYGALYNPLRSGHLFGVFVVIATWCAFNTDLREKQRKSAILCAIALFVGILLTGSRSPLLALLMLAIGLAALDLSAPRRHLCWGLLAVGIALIMMLFGRELLGRGLSMRPELWYLSLIKVQESPWVGVGLGADLILKTAGGDQLYDTHNVFLAALYYGGVIGLVLFVLLFVRAFWAAWGQRKKQSLFYLAAVLQVFGIATLQFDGGSLIGRPTEFWLLYWLPIGLTLFASRPRVAS